MGETVQRDDFDDAFEGLDALILATETSPEFVEEALVGEAQSLIVAAMADLSINRTELAARMGVSKARVSQMLSPECANLTLRLLGRAGYALDLKLKLVRADDVIARKANSGTWCIGQPWQEHAWEAARVTVEQRAANENRRKVDLPKAAGYLKQSVLEAA